MSVSNRILVSSSGYHAPPEELVSPTMLSSVVAKTTTTRLRDLITLAKPEITMMVTISTGLAYLMASDSFQVVGLLNAMLGTGMIAGGAGALNQYLERGRDATMRRTSKRPLPSGQVTVNEALWFGILLS